MTEKHYTIEVHSYEEFTKIFEECGFAPLIIKANGVDKYSVTLQKHWPRGSHL